MLIKIAYRCLVEHTLIQSTYLSEGKTIVEVREEPDKISRYKSSLTPEEIIDTIRMVDASARAEILLSDIREALQLLESAFGDSSIRRLTRDAQHYLERTKLVLERHSKLLV